MISLLVRFKKIQRSFTRSQWRTKEFFSGGGFQQIQLRTEDRDLGAVAPSHGVLEAAVIRTRNFISYFNFLIFWYFKAIYDDNQFICHC